MSLGAAARSAVCAHLLYLAGELHGRGADDARAVLQALKPHVGERDFSGRAVELRAVLAPCMSTDGFRRALGKLHRVSPGLFRRDGRGVYQIPLRRAWRAGRAELSRTGHVGERTRAVTRWARQATPPQGLPERFAGMRATQQLLARHPLAATGPTPTAAARRLLEAAGASASARDVERVGRGLVGLARRGLVRQDGAAWVAVVPRAAAGPRKVRLTTPGGLTGEGRLVQLAVDLLADGLIDRAEFEQRVGPMIPATSRQFRYAPPSAALRAERLAEVRRGRPTEPPALERLKFAMTYAGPAEIDRAAAALETPCHAPKSHSANTNSSTPRSSQSYSGRRPAASLRAGDAASFPQASAFRA